MERKKRYLAAVTLSLTISLVLSVCSSVSMEEEVIEPIEMMVAQKGRAASRAAMSNVGAVRAALLRYPAVSPTNEYPTDMDIYDYDSLNRTLADANLPLNMADLMWDPTHGITYRSDGNTFTFEVRSLTGDREIITATPEGVSKNLNGDSRM